MGQQLLRRRRPGRHQELEGLLLRLVRRLQLHHRGQATGLAVGHGDLGPDLRGQLVEHPGAPGPRGRGHRRPPLRHRAAVVHPGSGPAGRGGGGPDPGGHPDVPLQQSRRPAHPAADRWPPTPPSGPSRTAAAAGWCWPGPSIGFGFITKMLQAIILIPVLALVYLLAGPPKLGRRIVQVRLRRRGHGGGRRLVGGGGPADPGGRPALHRWLHRQQPPQPHLRLQRFRSAHRQRGGQRRGRLRRWRAGSMWGPVGLEPALPHARWVVRSPG